MMSAVSVSRNIATRYCCRVLTWSFVRYILVLFRLIAGVCKGHLPNFDGRDVRNLSDKSQENSMPSLVILRSKLSFSSIHFVAASSLHIRAMYW